MHRPPKPRLLTIAGTMPVISGRQYRMRVDEFGKLRSDSITVRLIHESMEHEGETLELELHLPVREVGRTADFFRALGIDPKVNQTIDLDALPRRRLLVVFTQSESGEHAPCRFLSVDEETSHV